MIEHTTTFTPADGSAPRTITLRISELCLHPEHEWSVTVEVLGFKHDLKTHLYQVDWPHAVRDAARFITDMVAGYAENLGGGTFDPDLYLPSRKKKKKNKRRRAKKDR